VRYYIKMFIVIYSFCYIIVSKIFMENIYIYILFFMTIN